MKQFGLKVRIGGVIKVLSLRVFLAVLVAGSAAIGVSSLTLPAWGQEGYPNKPITFLFGFSVGSGGDIATRLEAEAMSKQLGVPVVVRNVPGAGGRNAVTLLNRAKPDGYTMAIVNVPGQLVNQIVRGFPPDLRTFKWIGRAVAQPYFIQATKLSGISSLKDAQKATKPLRAGITGTGGNTFPISVIATSIVGYPVRFVPGFKSAEIIANLMRGDLEVSTLPVGDYTLVGVRSGKTKAIAIYTPERHPKLPDVPTGAEQGFPKLAEPTVMGTNLVALPPGTPDKIVDKLEAALAKALRDKEVVRKIEMAGNFVKPLTGKQATQLLADMIKLVEKNTPLLKPYVK